MKVEQIYNFVNSAFEETTGQSDLVQEDLSNIVDVGKALDASTPIGSNAYDNFVRSLIDHIGSGKDWDLARKDGGLILLPPFSEKHDKLYTTRLEALCSLTGFLSRLK